MYDHTFTAEKRKSFTGRRLSQCFVGNPSPPMIRMMSFNRKVLPLAECQAFGRMLGVVHGGLSRQGSTSFTPWRRRTLQLRTTKPRAEQPRVGLFSRC